MITHEDEKRYGLKPLPGVPFVGAAESRRLNEAYEAGRRRYLVDNPMIEAIEPGDVDASSTRIAKGPRLGSGA